MWKGEEGGGAAGRKRRRELQHQWQGENRQIHSTPNTLPLHGIFEAVSIFAAAQMDITLSTSEMRSVSILLFRPPLTLLSLSKLRSRVLHYPLKVRETSSCPNAMLAGVQVNEAAQQVSFY